ncbi:hypothetical protein DDZ14_01225 [Maritimibacter sp. 55A14]|uniref:hypothetical protein n=1 Tax=Maritimibacter sp. 55A14 TaxID=2174844 RepID=UPI000D61065F|nr:hypothetical protein [Maritimibacter sp. 55A14]PWE34360.1 hypothetical protein DDZ14_01225 [Maritimibacter sp. 55A14]
MSPGHDARWPVWRLALLLAPFAFGAVAINLFMLGLMAQAVGLSALSPYAAMAWALPLTPPASWAAGRWLRRLMDEAEG